MKLNFEWERNPPRPVEESPEDLRHQRDLYRGWCDEMLLEKWNGLTPADWTAEDGCQAQIDRMIEELVAADHDVR